jgi:hypothetical protein
MKTLDEVIIGLDICKNFSYCTHPQKGECPYLHEDNTCDQDDLYRDALHYLKVLKAKSEEPPLGEPPDYIPLNFHRLAEMIGKPVYVKDGGCKGHWEIVMGVKKTVDGEDVCFRGCDRWQRIGKTVYRTKEGAKE